MEKGPNINRVQTLKDLVDSPFRSSSVLTRDDYERVIRPKVSIALQQYGFTNVAAESMVQKYLDALPLDKLDNGTIDPDDFAMQINEVVRSMYRTVTAKSMREAAESSSEHSLPTNDDMPNIRPKKNRVRQKEAGVVSAPSDKMPPPAIRNAAENSNKETVTSVAELTAENEHTKNFEAHNVQDIKNTLDTNAQSAQYDISTDPDYQRLVENIDSLKKVEDSLNSNFAWEESPEIQKHLVETKQRQREQLFSEVSSLQTVIQDRIDQKVVSFRNYVGDEMAEMRDMMTAYDKPNETTIEKNAEQKKIPTKKTGWWNSAFQAEKGIKKIPIQAFEGSGKDVEAENNLDNDIESLSQEVVDLIAHHFHIVGSNESIKDLARGFYNTINSLTNGNLDKEQAHQEIEKIIKELRSAIDASLHKQEAGLGEKNSEEKPPVLILSKDKRVGKDISDLSEQTDSESLEVTPADIESLKNNIALWPLTNEAEEDRETALAMIENLQRLYDNLLQLERNIDQKVRLKIASDEELTLLDKKKTSLKKTFDSVKKHIDENQLTISMAQSAPAPEFLRTTTTPETPELKSSFKPLPGVTRDPSSIPGKEIAPFPDELLRERREEIRRTASPETKTKVARLKSLLKVHRGTFAAAIFAGLMYATPTDEDPGSHASTGFVPPNGGTSMSQLDTVLDVPQVSDAAIDHRVSPAVPPPGLVDIAPAAETTVPPPEPPTTEVAIAEDAQTSAVEAPVAPSGVRTGSLANEMEPPTLSGSDKTDIASETTPSTISASEGAPPAVTFENPDQPRSPSELGTVDTINNVAVPTVDESPAYQVAPGKSSLVTSADNEPAVETATMEAVYTVPETLPGHKAANVSTILWDSILGKAGALTVPQRYQAAMATMPRVELLNTMYQVIHTLDKDADFIKSLGIASGDVDVIQPGEKINLAPFFEKMFGGADMQNVPPVAGMETSPRPSAEALSVASVAETVVQQPDISSEEGESESAAAPVETAEVPESETPSEPDVAVAESADVSDAGSTDEVAPQAGSTEAAATPATPEINPKTPTIITKFAVEEFKSQYPGGKEQFASDISAWADTIQGVTTPKNTWTAALFAPGKKLESNAFATLTSANGGATVADMRELATYTGAQKTATFEQLQMSPEQFKKWFDQLLTWEQSGELGTILPTMKFSDIAEKAFVAEQLLKSSNQSPSTLV